jgi:hypothetical protein
MVWRVRGLSAVTLDLLMRHGRRQGMGGGNRPVNNSRTHSARLNDDNLYAERADSRRKEY